MFLFDLGPQDLDRRQVAGKTATPMADSDRISHHAIRLGIDMTSATTTKPGRLIDQAEADEKVEVVRLHGFVGRRLRAARLVQRTKGLMTVSEPIDHTLVFHMGGGHATRYDGRRQTGMADPRKVTTMAPAGQTNSWDLPENVDILHLYVDDADLRRFAEQEFGIDPDKLEMRDHMGVDDPFVTNLAPLILQELQSDLPQSRLMLDGFDAIVAGHMLRAYSNVSDIVVARRQAELNARDADVVRRAREILLDRLDENVPAEEVARAVGMNQYRLMRCFKAEMGITMHRFVVENRVAFVRDRLLRGRDSLAELSIDAGFANQSHMTACYSSIMGIAPGKHRAQLRG